MSTASAGAFLTPSARLLVAGEQGPAQPPLSALCSPPEQPLPSLSAQRRVAPAKGRIWRSGGSGWLERDSARPLHGRFSIFLRSLVRFFQLSSFSEVFFILFAATLLPWREMAFRPPGSLACFTHVETICL